MEENLSINNEFIQKFKIIQNKNEINFEYKRNNFTILKPNEKNRNFLLFSKNELFKNWISKLNYYIVCKNPDINSIFKKFKIISDKNIKNFDDNFDKVEDFNLSELKFQKEKKRIDSMILYEDYDKKTKQLFNSNKIIDILKNQYMNVWKFINENNIGEINFKNNSINEWYIKIKKFSNNNINNDLKLVNSLYNYNFIEIKLTFDKYYYPSNPPTLKIIRPRLKNSLMYRISNTKMLNIDYWNPSINCNDIILRIINLLDLHSQIDYDCKLNNFELFPHGSYFEFELILIKLLPYIDLGEKDIIDNDFEFIKLKDKIKNFDSQKNDGFWKSGTGFGHHGLEKWNIDEYCKIKEINKNLLIENLNELLLSLKKNLENSKINNINLFEFFNDSIIIKFLEQKIEESSLLEIFENSSLYDIIFDIINLLINDDNIVLFFKNDSKLFKSINKCSSESSLSINLDSSNEIANKIIKLSNNLTELYEKNIKNYNNTDNFKKENSIIVLDEKEFYANEMKKLSFKYEKINDQDFYYSKNSLNVLNMKKTLKRLSSEIPTMNDIFPVCFDSSIFTCIDNEKPYRMKFLITGPVDTPYDSGCFIFDAFTSDDYPSNPPEFRFSNHGGNRFNPNLYDNGKVCLSILNTYIGPKPDKSELWIPKESTLYQVVLSIVGQILIEEPYFNEPGYEKEIGKASGIQNSKEYNFKIRLYNMKNNIKEMIENPIQYSNFTDIIINHFKIKKIYITELCNYWVNEAKEFVNEKIEKKTISSVGNNHYQKLLNEYIETNNSIKNLLNNL